jgi:hypothetical protein
MKIKDEREPTQPFEPQEMAKILAAVANCDFSTKRAAQVHALILLMRWSMLSIIDATTLAKSELQQTAKEYRIVRRRIKTGVQVNVLNNDEWAVLHDGRRSDAKDWARSFDLRGEDVKGVDHR